MGRRVRDFIEISDYTSLDGLINTLVAIRDNLPEDAEPELKLRGDDVFALVGEHREVALEAMREGKLGVDGECVGEPLPGVGAVFQVTDEGPIVSGSTVGAGRNRKRMNVVLHLAGLSGGC